GDHVGLPREPSPTLALPDIDVRIAPVERLRAALAAKLTLQLRCEGLAAHDDRDIAADRHVFRSSREAFGGDLSAAHVCQELRAAEDMPAGRIDAQVGMGEPVE